MSSKIEPDGEEEIIKDISSSEEGTDKDQEVNSEADPVETKNNKLSVGTDIDAVLDGQISPERLLEAELEETEQKTKQDPDESNSMENSDQFSPKCVLEIIVSGGTDSEVGTGSEISSQDQLTESQNLENEDKKQDSEMAQDLSSTIEITTTIGSTISTDSEASSTTTTTPDKWRNLIGGLMNKKKKKKKMGRATSFPTNVLTKNPSLKWCLDRLRSVKEDKNAIVPEEEVAIMPEEIGKFKPSWRSFEYQELLDATKKFSKENLIGKGGHAEVYKGQLGDGQIIAVKRLTKGKNEETRMGDFLSELGIIAHVNHPNAAQLLGFSADGGLHMVLKYSPHGSLASLLHGSKEKLKWKARYNIALGMAEGLLYLHDGCHRRIIHRDIKASNILLTEDYQPQISDFGLAKWLPDNWSHHVIFPIEGTFGYLAPEYFMHGVANEKTDVFAFGVILLELITGRKAVDSSRQSLVIWAKPLLDLNKVTELVDPKLENAYDSKEMAKLLMVASMCIHRLPTSRPSMNSVVKLLKGEEGSMEHIGRELKPKAVMPLIIDTCDSEDYTRSRYLNDLNRHKQLALQD